MPSPSEDRQDGIWPDEAMIRPPIEVLGEDGVARPLNEDPQEDARASATVAAGDVQWLEGPIAAETLRDVKAATGVFTAKVSWHPCGPGDVVLGWMHPLFNEDSRVFASVAAGTHTSGSEHQAAAGVIVTQTRTQTGKLLLGVVVAGERPVSLHVDILVVNP